MDVLTTPGDSVSAFTQEHYRTSPTGSYTLKNGYTALVDTGATLITKRVRTPHYAARVARGELIPMTFFDQVRYGASTSQYMHQITNYPGIYVEAYRDEPGARDTTLISDGIESLAESLLTEHSNSAAYFVQSAAAAIYSSGWDALTFLAEFRESYHLLSSVVPRMTRAIRSNRLWKSGVPSWRDIRDDYMSARYGWRPLVYDVRDLAQLLTQLDKSFNRVSRKAGTTVRNSTETTITPYTGSLGGVTYTEDWLVRTTSELGIRGSVTADFQPPKILIDPYVTAWEVTRLSFVVDWVINVGQAIQAAQLLSKAKAVCAAQGLSVAVTADAEFKPSVSDTSKATFVSTGFAHAFYERQYRVPCSVPAFPMVRLRLDGLKVLDLISIASQVRK